MEEANKKSGLQTPVEGGEFPQSTLHYIICITVESGLLNTLSAIGTLVTYVTQSSSVYIMTAIVRQNLYNITRGKTLTL